MVMVALAIVAKNSLAFLAMMVLVHVTPFRTLLAAMGRLGLPALIVSTLQFMERQIHILGDELRRMVQARRSRTFRKSGRLDFVRLTGLIGMLFLRSFERGERVHAFRGTEHCRLWRHFPGRVAGRLHHQRHYPRVGSGNIDQHRHV